MTRTAASANAAHSASLRPADVPMALPRQLGIARLPQISASAGHGANTLLRADCNILFFVAAFSTHSSHLALLEAWLKVSPGRPAMGQATRTLSAILLVARCGSSGDSRGALNE